jgi:PilZ domain
MKRLIWIHTNGVRAFGCTGCKWTHPVKEFKPGFSASEVREDFAHHNCRTFGFRFESDRSSPLCPSSDSTAACSNGDQILRDLCGLQGTVLAAIEGISSPASLTGNLEATKAELDSARSLLWLHMRASPDTEPDLGQTVSNERQKRRWPRYHFHVPVTLTTSAGHTIIQALGTDLNEGGVTIFSEVELKVADDLNLELRPPFSNTVLKLRVVVRNRNGNRYGMEFIGANDADSQEIVLLRTIVRMLEARVSYYEQRAADKVVP